MFKNIGIENFRIFKDYTEFELAPITILTGPNNSGKSSFLKLLGLLKYSFGEKDNLSKLSFDGGTHNLGTFEKVISWNNESKDVKVVLDFPLEYFDEDFKLELSYCLLNEDGFLKSFRIFNDRRELISLNDLKVVDHNYMVNYSINIDLKYIIRTINQHIIGSDINNYSKDIQESYKKHKKTFKERGSLRYFQEIARKRQKGEIKYGCDEPYNVKEYAS